MVNVNRWLLPEGVEELLPEQAAQLESLRRQLLDYYQCWGYQLVRPPLIEFLEALQVGTGRDLALQTFTLTDQASGRLLGLRADLTPQVARMDAHSLKRDAVTRLCYCAPVLHSKASTLGASRELDQIGVELFGASSLNADLEVINLMVGSAELAGAFQDNKQVKLDLGNVTIYRHAARFAGLNHEQELELCDILQRKSMTELSAFIDASIDNQEAARLISVLPTLCGDVRVLETAQKLFASLSDKHVSKALQTALEKLKQVFAFINEELPELECYFDLSELRGYDYHTGLVFALYKEGHSEALAKGGRYDDIGESFGRSRPATGFSCDLRQILSLSKSEAFSLRSAIFAPAADFAGENAESLKQSIKSLREEKETVVQAFSDNLDEANSLKAAYCNRELVFNAGSWEVRAIK